MAHCPSRMSPDLAILLFLCPKVLKNFPVIGQFSLQYSSYMQCYCLPPNCTHLEQMTHGTHDIPPHWTGWCSSNPLNLYLVDAWFVVSQVIRYAWKVFMFSSIPQIISGRTVIGFKLLSSISLLPNHDATAV